MSDSPRRAVALVTGGGSGLGAAIARRLSADGMHVVVNDIDGSAAAKVAFDLAGDAAVFDVADSAAVDRAFDGVVARHGRLDVLVNNAGIAAFRPGLADRTMATISITDDAWTRMIGVHLNGTFFCTRAALRSMHAARRGCIVNMASIAGIHGFVTAPDYAAAKGGIIAFTRSVAAEVGPIGVRVNAVAPGFIETPLTAGIPSEGRTYIAGRTVAGRLGRPEEVADVVAFLAGESSTYCFGEVFTVTGGWD